MLYNDWLIHSCVASVAQLYTCRCTAPDIITVYCNDQAAGICCSSTIPNLLVFYFTCLSYASICLSVFNLTGHGVLKVLYL